jgi:hypothetical protein
MSYPVPIRHWLLPARHCLPRPRVVSRCPTLILSPTLPIFCRLRDSTSPVGRSLLILPPWSLRSPRRSSVPGGRRPAGSPHGARRRQRRRKARGRAASAEHHSVRRPHDLMSSSHQAAPQQPAGGQVIFFSTPPKIFLVRSLLKFFLAPSLHGRPITREKKRTVPRWMLARGIWSR